VSNAHLAKLVLAWWVIAPPACCLVRSQTTSGCSARAPVALDAQRPEQRPT